VSLERKGIEGFEEKKWNEQVEEITYIET